MSHLETATFDDERGAINAPLSGVTAPGIDPTKTPRETLQILLDRGWMPLIYPTIAAAVEAAKKTSNAWGEHR